MDKELDISKSIADELPSSLRQSLAKLSKNQQLNFEEDYKQQGWISSLSHTFPHSTFFTWKNRYWNFVLVNMVWHRGLVFY